ncbi:hypothetical protein CLF_112595 [Clonorchis sinensis]|uniref:Endonuclease/exonuclease/phosphatase domain-containing protein n=1 Tax=Clonorchis sinensis TaxID=79923 RepID=G7YML2_CLOSI|nr:hypothetical protein CLF_112595 [Clonorchis sinensis]
MLTPDVKQVGKSVPIASDCNATTSFGAFVCVDRLRLLNILGQRMPLKFLNKLRGLYSHTSSRCLYEVSTHKALQHWKVDFDYSATDGCFRNVESRDYLVTVTKWCFMRDRFHHAFLFRFQNPGAQKAAGESPVGLEYAVHIVFVFEEEKAQVFLDELTIAYTASFCVLCPPFINARYYVPGAYNHRAVHGRPCPLVITEQHLRNTIGAEIEVQSFHMIEKPHYLKCNPYLKTVDFDGMRTTVSSYLSVSLTVNSKIPPLALPTILLHLSTINTCVFSTAFMVVLCTKNINEHHSLVVLFLIAPYLDPASHPLSAISSFAFTLCMLIYRHSVIIAVYLFTRSLHTFSGRYLRGARYSPSKLSKPHPILSLAKLIQRSAFVLPLLQTSLLLLNTFWTRSVLFSSRNVFPLQISCLRKDRLRARGSVAITWYRTFIHMVIQIGQNICDFRPLDSTCECPPSYTNPQKTSISGQLKHNVRYVAVNRVNSVEAIKFSGKLSSCPPNISDVYIQTSFPRNPTTPQHNQAPDFGPLNRSNGKQVPNTDVVADSETYANRPTVDRDRRRITQCGRNIYKTTEPGAAQQAPAVRSCISSETVMPYTLRLWDRPVLQSQVVASNYDGSPTVHDDAQAAVVTTLTLYPDFAPRFAAAQKVQCKCSAVIGVLAAKLELLSKALTGANTKNAATWTKVDKQLSSLNGYLALSTSGQLTAKDVIQLSDAAIKTATASLVDWRKNHASEAGKIASPQSLTMNRFKQTGCAIREASEHLGCSLPSAVQKILERAVSIQKTHSTTRHLSENHPLEARKLGHSSSRREVRRSPSDSASSADPKLKAKPIVVTAPCAPKSTLRQPTATPDSRFYSTTADASKYKGNDALEEASLTWTGRLKCGELSALLSVTDDEDAAVNFTHKSQLSWIGSDELSQVAKPTGKPTTCPDPDIGDAARTWSPRPPTAKASYLTTANRKVPRTPSWSRRSWVIRISTQARKKTDCSQTSHIRFAESENRWLALSCLSLPEDDQFLIRTLEQLSSSYHFTHLLLLGDFNAPKPPWTELQLSNKSWLYGSKAPVLKTDAMLSTIVMVATFWGRLEIVEFQCQCPPNGFRICEAMVVGCTKDVIFIVRVQRATSKMVAGLNSVDYETCLAVLNLFSLESLGLRRDLILTYALFEQGLANRFFTVDPASTRWGHGPSSAKSAKDDRQRGVLSQRSLNSCQLRFFEAITAAYDAEHSTVAVYLDIQKTFTRRFAYLRSRPPFLKPNYLLISFTNGVQTISEFDEDTFSGRKKLEKFKK